MRYQWTRLAHGVPSPQFVEQVKKLLEAPKKSAAAGGRAATVAPAARSSGFPVGIAVTAGVVVLGAVGYFALRPGAKESAAPAKAIAETKSAAPAAVEKPAAPKVDDKSVAVLAFANLSDDKENEYFSDGISEELLTVLQKIPGLHVAARTSAFSFKGKNLTAQEIGEKLGVAHLVEGSVQKSGSRVKIAARLSRAATGEQLWSDNFTRDLKDVFAVQSEIAQTIVEQLRGQLGGVTKAAIQAQVQAAEIGGTKNAEAHQLYLQGRFLSNQFTRENLIQSATCFRRAVELDPAFALAWAELSRTLSVQGAYGIIDQPLPEIFKESRAIAERALALAPNLAEAHAALFQVQASYDLDWRRAAESARRALELAPSNATNLLNSAQMAAVFGEIDRSVELIRQALALDPLNSAARNYLAGAYTNAGKLKEAEEENRRILEFNPSTIGGQWSMSSILLFQGRVEEAAATIEREKEEWARLTGLAIIRWAQKKPAESDAALQQLTERFADLAAYQVAEVYAYRGDPDRAFPWLERALRQHDSGLTFLRLDKFMKNLTTDPRWPVFLRKVGLADEQLK